MAATIAALLDAGADPCRENSAGLTALDLLLGLVGPGGPGANGRARDANGGGGGGGAGCLSGLLALIRGERASGGSGGGCPHRAAALRRMLAAAAGSARFTAASVQVAPFRDSDADWRPVWLMVLPRRFSPPRSLSRSGVPLRLRSLSTPSVADEPTAYELIGLSCDPSGSGGGGGGGAAARPLLRLPLGPGCELEFFFAAAGGGGGGAAVGAAAAIVRLILPGDSAAARARLEQGLPPQALACAQPWGPRPAPPPPPHQAGSAATATTAGASRPASLCVVSSRPGSTGPVAMATAASAGGGAAAACTPVAVHLRPPPSSDAVTVHGAAFEALLTQLCRACGVQSATLMAGPRTSGPEADVGGLVLPPPHLLLQPPAPSSSSVPLSGPGGPGCRPGTREAALGSGSGSRPAPLAAVAMSRGVGLEVAGVQGRDRMEETGLNAVASQGAAGTAVGEGHGPGPGARTEPAGGERRVSGIGGDLTGRAAAATLFGWNHDSELDPGTKTDPAEGNDPAAAGCERPAVSSDRAPMCGDVGRPEGAIGAASTASAGAGPAPASSAPGAAAVKPAPAPAPGAAVASASARGLGGRGQEEGRGAPGTALGPKSPAAASRSASWSRDGGGGGGNGGGGGGALCVVCLSASPVVGFRHGPTVHCCSCYACAQQLLEQPQQGQGQGRLAQAEPALPRPAAAAVAVSCPLCRQAVEEVLLVFTA